MTIEESIRQRQKFDQGTAEFLRALGALTTEEVEIALARVADCLLSAQGTAASMTLGIRGRVLKHYHDLRLAETVSQVKFGRKKMRKSGAKKIARSKGKSEYDSALVEWRKANSEFQKALANWLDERKGISWLKRRFVNTKPPTQPRLQSLTEYSNAQIWKADSPSVASELLVEFAATYELPLFPHPPEDLEKSDILKLIG